MKREEIYRLYRIYGTGVDFLAFAKGIEAYEADKRKAEELKKAVKGGALVASKFLTNNKLRCETYPIFTGIFHSEGHHVVTDGRYLLRMAADYPEEREGKVFDKDGAQLDLKYPDWRRVTPAPNEMYEDGTLTLESLAAAMSVSNSKSDSKLAEIQVDFGGVKLSLTMVKYAMKFMRAGGATRVWKPKQNALNAAWLMTKDNGDLFVFMPLTESTNCRYVWSSEDGSLREAADWFSVSRWEAAAVEDFE